MRTALIIGASGLCGKKLTQLLLSDTYFDQVKVFVRTSLPINHPKLVQVLTDFDNLPTISAELKGEALFCCIGTTIKKAGTREAFAKVDLDIPVNFGSLAKQAAVPQMLVISAIGANAGSSNFYLRTKGKMEKALEALDFESLHIFRPSLIDGERSERRLAEKISMMLMRAMNPLLLGGLRKYRSISPGTIVQSMLGASLQQSKGLHIYEYNDMVQPSR